MNFPSTIYEFVRQQEVVFGQDIEVLENWNWNMKEHIRTSMLFKHGKFKTATNTLETKDPFKNVVYPILNLRYRAEDIDVKDIVFYVNDETKDHLSLLVKKYHEEVYAKEHQLDTFFDEAKEEKIDFGGVLVRKAKSGPQYEPMESIAFCDQTDLLSGPIGFKQFYSPDQLYEMEKQGWGNVKNGANVTVDELITLAENKKQQETNKGYKNTTPGKYIEIYRVHGSLPIQYLKDDGDQNERYVRQFHILGFYKGESGKDEGVTLYKAQEYENPFKTHLSGKKIRNRALAYGGVEELFDTQIWTNFSEIKKKDMLEAASKVIFQTADEAYAARNKIKDMENLEITVTRDGTAITQVPTGSPNIRLFNEWIREWEVQGRFTSGATEAILGVQPSAGTPFRSLQLQAVESHGLHDYRRGKYATFIEEIYRDWILPDIARELSQGKKFFAILNADELEYVVNRMEQNAWENHKKERVLSGELVFEAQKYEFQRMWRERFLRRGNRQPFELLKDELKDVPLKVQVNISGKQQNLSLMVDKFVNVLRQMLATYNPQTRTFAIFDDPRMVKIFSKLIEQSGLNPVDFGVNASVPSLGTERALATEPLQELTKTQPGASGNKRELMNV